MRAPISIIIPTLNAEAHLPNCLNALMEGLEAGLVRELIVSDGGSSDATGATAQAWGAEVLHGPACRGGQLQRACEAAQADWLMIIHPDTVLQPGWSGHVRRHLAHLDQAAWFKLEFDTGGMVAWFLAGWANLRGRLGMPYGEQGLLVSAALYARVGGYQDMPTLEDVAMARALSGKLVNLPVIALTNAEKYRRDGWMRRGLRNLWTLLRFAAGSDIARLTSSYRR